MERSYQMPKTFQEGDRVRVVKDVLEKLGCSEENGILIQGSGVIRNQHYSMAYGRWMAMVLLDGQTEAVRVIDYALERE